MRKEIRPIGRVGEGNPEVLKAFSCKGMSTYHYSLQMEGGVLEKLHGAPGYRGSVK